MLYPRYTAHSTSCSPHGFQLRNARLVVLRMSFGSARCASGVWAVNTWTPSRGVRGREEEEEEEEESELFSGLRIKALEMDRTSNGECAACRLSFGKFLWK